MKKRLYISVILPLKLEWEPCYFVCSADKLNDKADKNGCPESKNDVACAQIGQRVRVIFSGKEYIGVVSGVGIIPETAPEKIKEICGFEEGMGRIFPEEIELWRQIADYYLCTVGEVYKAAYPIGKINLEEARSLAKEKAEIRQRKRDEALTARKERLEIRLEKKADLLSRAKKDNVREKYQSEIESIRREMALLDALRNGGHASNIGGGAAALKDGSAEVLAAGGDMAAESGARGLEKSIPRPSLTLTQNEALTEIKKAFETSRPVLLNGVTGSGKTEIYISLALEALEQGQNVLYLVPEISLSRQLEDRLEKYFGERLMVFHSRETAAERRNTAERIREASGNYIVLGTRSSLFLPHNNLGLIIVDEEHDSSYKQDSPAPRYNGRDTALILSTIHKSNIILGSATPSLEELYNCSKGRHVLVILKERFHGSDDSLIEIIDTKAERKKNGMKGSFSRKLIAHIEETLNSGGQVIILRARRAWATSLQCETCGEIHKCPHCNVSMSYHKAAGKMVCHWCGTSIPFTGQCGKCGGNMVTFGAGTQKIEEEAAVLFPQARIARLDSDTVQNRNFEKKTIKEFSEGKIDILIGTQIVTKGFDFSNLSMVAVIAADSLLGVQDFRADEKALQLLQQLRGRCGRRSERGQFIIQTAQPDHPVYTNLNEGSTESFSLNLLQERQDFSYPPYTRIVEIEIKDTFEDRAERMAGRLCRKLSGMNFTGPYKPAVSKVADKHICMIRISLAKDRMLKIKKDRIRSIITSFEKENRYDGHITINVDPS
jgi:primosomal protein N' (replication factor Y)